MPISRFHYTDLKCAAMNGGAETQEIFDRLEAQGRFDEIIEDPKPGQFLADYSVCFMYPHKITALVDVGNLDVQEFSNYTNKVKKEILNKKFGSM